VRPPRCTLTLLGLLAIGIADGQAGDTLPRSTQTPESHDTQPGNSLPRSRQSPASHDAPPRAIPSPARDSRDRPASTPSGVVNRPNAAEFYPTESIRLGEEGRVLIKLCYDKNGRVVESTLVESSGVNRLDVAAVRMGRDFQFKPATENGVPANGCVSAPIVFRLAGSAAPAMPPTR
jgi:protein TonB